MMDLAATATVVRLVAQAAMVAPPLYTGVFAHFTGTDAPVRFAGAPLVLAAAIALVTALLFWRGTRLLHTTGPKPAV